MDDDGGDGRKTSINIELHYFHLTYLILYFLFVVYL